ncbi:hypothetical protein [Brachyspira sp. G79]|uniref:hypothetical protein n=1 Tax=Brachyspira sp. G79 TaxID=1358104 RepID=UPI000BBC9743|nr:hypothetical protein [Brachyspira sp. G79]PCG19380.1 hypothetical protein KQ44_04565 [Brachyspira sp. G79]
MRKTIFIFFIMILSVLNLYSQFPGLNYNTFINAYIDYTGMYNNIPKETLDILTSSEQMNKLFDDGIKSFTFGELISIAQNPEKVLDTTTNESVILLVGTTLGFLEVANMQQGTASAVLNALKNKTAFNAASGNNTGLLIPMHTPIGSFGINLYSDVPLLHIDYIKNPTRTQNDYEALSKALDILPIPHVNAYLQVNLGPIPLALTLRGGISLGFKEIYGAVVNDVEIESMGWNIGASLKAYLFRTKYFFGDLRFDFNYDVGNLNLDVRNRNIYVPLYLGYNGGTETGVVFNGNAFLRSKWKTFALSPKLVFGFKMKEKVPVIQYLAAYFSVGADITFGSMQSTVGVNGIGSYANIVGHEIIANDLYIPNSSDKQSYKLYDMRVGFHFDIFYQSLAIEYGIFTKQFAVSFIPINIRF